MRGASLLVRKLCLGPAPLTRDADEQTVYGLGRGTSLFCTVLELDERTVDSRRSQRRQDGPTVALRFGLDEDIHLHLGLFDRWSKGRDVVVLAFGDFSSWESVAWGERSAEVSEVDHSEQESGVDGRRETGGGG